MNLLITAFQAPAATAAGSFVSAPLAAAIAINRPLSGHSAAAASSLQQEHKVRQMASLATHRAQVLAQRRTSIPSSAKRW